MRRVDNPRQRFQAQYVEWLGDVPARLEVYEETTTRSVLSSNESPDVPFRWSVNPYRGCTHACAYCYARPTHEYLDLGAGTDFETKIVVKRHAARLLRRALERPGWAAELIAFSGNTDCYQPLEAHYRITRECLEACHERANPVGLITKSLLVSRDADLLAAMNERGGATVTVSIPFADDRLARLIEPGTPRPTDRFEALRRLSAAGVPTGVAFAPVIPGLNEEAIPSVLERAREAGASVAHFQMLRLPHSVKDVFLQRVTSALPDRAARIESRIRELRGGELTRSGFGERHAGLGPYWKTIADLFRLHARRLGLAEHHARATSRPRPGSQLSLFEG